MAALLLLAPPVVAQLPDSAVLAAAAALWKESSSQSSNTRLLGGIEIAQSIADVVSDSAALLLGAPHQLSTIVSGDALLESGRFSLFGQGGLSFSDSGRSQFGRLASTIDLGSDTHEFRAWQIGVDATDAGSALSPRILSVGLLAEVGVPGVIQVGLRRGERWRGDDPAPVWTVNAIHVTTMHRGQTWIWVSASASATMTQVPSISSFSETSPTTPNSVPEYFVQTDTKHASLGDLSARLQALRGLWMFDANVAARIGTSVNVWGDPISYPYTTTYTAQSSGGHVAAAARIGWTPIAPIMVNLEFARQLSDPLLGLASVQYVSLSLRLNLESRLTAKLLQQSQALLGSPIQRAPADAHQSDVAHNTLAIDTTLHNDGSRLLVLQDVQGDTVEIAGDFTQWASVRLAPCTAEQMGNFAIEEHGAVRNWCGTFHLPSGVYHVLYRSDGGAWQVPAGVQAITDTFGGQLGLMVIP